MTDERTPEKKYLISVAERICIPALEKAINQIRENKPYFVTDHVSFECTKLEALLRPLWGIAFLLGERSYTVTVAGKKCDLAAALRALISEMCDDSSPLSFSRYAANTGKSVFANQMITEFAAYCIALTAAPDALWEPYSGEEKARIGGVIRKWALTALAESWRNNHFWFPILAITALEKIGIDCGDADKAITDGFSVLDGMYIGNGWYMDGEFGRFDYYLAWSHHVYPLLWSRLAEGTGFEDKARSAEYKRRAAEFFDYYIHFFDLDGSVPPFGRSLSYRFAESACFAAAAYAGVDWDYGLMRRALLKNVSYFMDNMTISEDGVLGAGYLYESSATVENYTSSAGAYWCSKAFLALALNDCHPFWTAEEKPLPSEIGEYFVTSGVDNINLPVEGSRTSGVTLYNGSASYYSAENGLGGRFNDMGSYYGKFVYNSRFGFGISAADNISYDSMISLETADGTMESRRIGYTDLGVRDGALVSEHRPFANDSGTVIKSWVIPVGGGCHVRAHKVTLASPYKVREGGFSVGVSDDGYGATRTAEYIEATDGRGKRSGMHTVSDTVFSYRLHRHNPGMHLLAPQSIYPTYFTNVLPTGEYRFATVFWISTEGDVTPPEIFLADDELTVGGRTYIID